MKKVLLFLLIIFTNGAAFSQSNIPDLINLTAIARDQNNQLVTSQTIDVQVEITQGQNGTSEYCELYTNISTNSAGEFSIQFGINPQYLCQQSGNMGTVDWNLGNLWYKLSYRITGGQLTEIDNRRISSVPFAFASRTAEKLVTQGTNGQVLTYQNGNWIGANPATVNIPQIAIFEDANNNVSGGTSVVGWQLRKLNSQQFNNTNNAVSLNSVNSFFTLTPGVYRITASAPGYRVGAHWIGIFAQGTSTPALFGSTTYADLSGGFGFSDATLDGAITVTSTTNYELRHYCSNVIQVDGLGVSANPLLDKYSRVVVTKIQ